MLINANKTSSYIKKMKVIIIMTTISWFFTSFTETFDALMISHWSLNTMI